MRAVIYILFNWIWNWIILSFPSFNVLVTSFRTLFEVNPRWSSLALLWIFLQLQLQLQFQLRLQLWMFLQPVSQQETGSIPSIQTAFTIYLVACCQGALVCFLINMTSPSTEGKSMRCVIYLALEALVNSLALARVDKFI